MYQKVRNVVFTLSLVLFPLTFYYFSPAIPLIGASEGILAGSLILFFFLFLFSMVMGRIFCSWICPAGALQDLVGRSRSKAVPVRYISWIKYLVWVPWLILVLVLFRRAGGIERADFLYQTEMGVSLTRFADAIIYGVIILVFFGLSLIVGRRAACHTICWMSPFMILGRRLGLLLKVPSIKIQADPDRCVSCGRCDVVCPMSLPVEKKVSKGGITDSNCILCGNCIDVCGRKVIGFAWS